MKLSGVSILQKYVKKTLKFDLVLVIVLFLESEGLNAYYITKLINPLRPNIHKQILQTNLHTLPLRISWENLVKDQIFFSLWSFC